MNSIHILLYIIISNQAVWVHANLNAKGFIRAQGTKFVDANCEEYIFNGWNSWMMIESGIGRVKHSHSVDFEGQSSLEWMMDTAVEAKMNSFRIFGHGNNPDIMTLQISPGNYDQQALKGLDKVLDLASRRNLRVIPTFADNWKKVDSKWNYVQWSNSAKWADDFYVDENSRRMFRDHMKFIVNRVNSINGRIYREDPTILAWNLMNEPRSEENNCNQPCAQKIQTWIDEMSNFLKSVDPNHMITVGEEGFYGWYSGKEYANPDAWVGKWGTWAMKSGQNFVPNHAGDAIDFAAIHIWVDNWSVEFDGLNFFSKWIDEHANDARQMNKPLVVEEYGKVSWSESNFPWERNPYFQLAFEKLYNSMQNDGPLNGMMWWEWEVDEHSAMEQYAVKTKQSTWKEHIQPQSIKIQEFQNQQPLVSNCVPGDWMSFQALYFPQKNRITVQGADKKIKVTGISVEKCLQRCEDVKSQCTSFVFNEQNGECILKKRSSRAQVGTSWSSDGTTTYWRQVGGKCVASDKNCVAYSQEGTCIECSKGYLLHRNHTDFFSKPTCRRCEEFPEAIRSKATACSNPSSQ